MATSFESRSAAAKKAAETRKKNVLKKKRSLAAKKAAETRKAKALAKAQVSPASAPATTTPTPPAPTVPAVPPKVLKNRIAIVLDGSGSMDCIRAQAVQVVNDTLETIQREASQGGPQDETLVSLFCFNNYGVHEVFKNQNSKGLTAFGISQYAPDGGTPLYDSVMKAIDSINTSDAETSFVVLAITDGCENASRTPADTLCKRMQQLQSTDRWTFAFLLPPSYIAAFKSLAPGVPEGNIKAWENIKDVGTATTQGVSNFYRARASGQRSVKQFFAVDLSKTTPEAIRALPDISGSNMKVWQVEKEMPIKEFVESKLGLGKFEPGHSFYQLTKKETVQDYKGMLVMDKLLHGSSRGKAIYDGIKGLLGVPTSGDVSMAPGNIGDFDIFVQSNSDNRKLVRGTRLIYKV